MTKTEHYQLNQWDPEDPIRRTDFNEDNAKLDAALACKGNCQIVIGTYVGTGEYGVDHPTSLDFADTMGKAPMMFFVGGDGSIFLGAVKGMDIFGYSGANDGSTLANITWTETGVSWYGAKSATPQMNRAGRVYYYSALFD